MTAPPSLTLASLARATSTLAAQTPAAVADRAGAVGASEVGICPRLVVHRRLTGHSPGDGDPVVAGRLLRGRALEGLGIKILREAIAGTGLSLTRTGARQATFQDRAIRVHPDGVMDDDGVTFPVEVKSRSHLTPGAPLPSFWVDQVTAQAGAMGTEAPHGLILAVDSDSPGVADLRLVPFDADRYVDLQRRATLILANEAAGTLPPGEPDRSPTPGCRGCPLRDDCQERTIRLAQADPDASIESIPLEAAAALRLDAHDLAQVEAAIAPLEERRDTLRASILATMAPTGIRTLTLDNARITLAETTRTTLDTKAIKTSAPEVYAQYARTTTSTTLRVTYSS